LILYAILYGDKLLRLLPLVAVLLLFLSCDSATSVQGGNINKPLTYNDPNDYEFVLNARGYSSTKFDTLDFSGSGNRLNLLVTPYLGGAASFRILDTNGINIFVDTVSAGELEVNTILNGVPGFIDMQFLQISGQISVTLKQ
jgi:hypothetical protein